MRVYRVEFTPYQSADPDVAYVEANSKEEAYDKVVWEHNPYSAWVDSVRFKNGKIKRFNTFEGKPY